MLRMLPLLALLSLAACASQRAAHDEGPMSIHQEVTIHAPVARVYEALTDAKQFAQLTGRPVAQLSGTPGETFTMFDGIILGRNIEMLPARRIVQAWRERTWPPGVYSIVKFDLEDHAQSTRIIFDHTGYPQGAGAHLQIGWHENYWDPLKKFLEK